MKTKYTLEEKIKIVNGLEDVGRGIKTEAGIAADELARAKAAFAAAVRDIEDRFNGEAWNTVEANWTAEEIKKANQ